MTALDDATLAAIAARDAGSPLCRWVIPWKGDACDTPVVDERHARCPHPYPHGPVSGCHPFQYDPALDTSAEADRRRLLADNARLRRELGDRDCEDGDGR
jgi:hypothetical protein